MASKRNQAVLHKCLTQAAEAMQVKSESLPAVCACREWPRSPKTTTGVSGKHPMRPVWLGRPRGVKVRPTAAPPKTRAAR
jgi:hypothetical protein